MRRAFRGALDQLARHAPGAGSAQNFLNFWEDPSARRLWLTLAVLCGLWSAALAGLALAGTAAFRAVLLAHDEAVASALLAQGVAPGAAAAALSSARSTPAGQNLLAAMGRPGPLWYGPAGDWGGPALAGALGAAALFTALILLAAALALHRREQAARRALAVVRRFAAGDFAARLRWDAAGTPGQLLIAVNELATALQARGEAERQSRVFLRDTIQDISHQIKTPLAALDLYHELLAVEAEDPVAVRHFAAQSAAAAERIGQLVQMLLKLARLDAGGIRFEKQWQNLATLAARAAEPLRQRARQEGKTLVFTGDGSARLLCDAAWTVEALGNLLKNALDHTAPGGRVELTWVVTPLGVRLTVRDDGEGIPPQDLPHIFKRFYRSADPTRAQGPGLGLGLPLARAIVEGQGGSLTAASRPGAGSEFTASFP